MTLSDSHARLGVIEKFDSEGLQCKLDFADGNCAAGDRLGTACFHVSDRVHVNPSRVRYLLLINPRQSACGFQLISRGKHELVSASVISVDTTEKIVIVPIHGIKRIFSRIAVGVSNDLPIR
jgi:hypothetical protein